MPIYEYDCKQCRRPFEKLIRSIPSSEPILCPECGSAEIERTLSKVVVKSGAAKAPAMPIGCDRCGSPDPCPNG